MHFICLKNKKNKLYIAVGPRCKIVEHYTFIESKTKRFFGLLDIDRLIIVAYKFPITGLDFPMLIDDTRV